MIAEGEHLRVEFTQVFQLAVGSVHPPYVLFRTADFGQVELHHVAVVVVHQQIVIATGGDETVVLFAVVLDDALVGYTLKVGERENKALQVLHLREAGVFQSLIPGLHITGIAIRGGIAGL